MYSEKVADSADKEGVEKVREKKERSKRGTISLTGDEELGDIDASKILNKTKNKPGKNKTD